MYIFIYIYIYVCKWHSEDSRVWLLVIGPPLDKVLATSHLPALYTVNPEP